ncbi:MULTISPECIES: MBL fold metallo-hydrolase [Anaerolinea]|uniref:MBL fold metallo-hydrolase n=1 Tax=Anaerolinea TaxID=233189 RepID=UPI002615357A|nr:MBL fold metallo-hydrolase [Anaerolinea thermophila]
MTLEILTFELGPLSNNTYLLVDTSSSSATVIDPAFGSSTIVKTCLEKQITIENIWITHAHFDHIGGIEAIRKQFPRATIALHALDLDLWKDGGGSQYFGFHMKPLPNPEIMLVHHQTLQLGNTTIEVVHTPGHSPGHVCFILHTQKMAFTGDLIFYRGIGRTDLPGGDPRLLFQSILEQIYTLPEEYLLLSGHGPTTTVGEEKMENPYITI